MGPSWPWSYGSWIYNYICNQCLSPLILWVQISIRARCTTLCHKVCQWLVTSRRFSPVSSTNKTDRHDITEILLKVPLNIIKQTNKNNIIRTPLLQWKSDLSWRGQFSSILLSWCVWGVGFGGLTRGGLLLNLVW